MPSMPSAVMPGFSIVLLQNVKDLNKMQFCEGLRRPENRADFTSEKNLYRHILTTYRMFQELFRWVLKTRLGYRHTDDYVWPFNCLEFFWVHKYPFKRCGWFFGIWKAELIFAFLDAREQGKRLKLSQWQVRKIHDTVKRMLSYAGPVWKRLHLTIWTPSWELKQTEDLLDAC